MLQPFNILLLGAGNRVSFCECLIEAGLACSRKVNIFSVEIKNPVPISKYATILNGERWYSPKFSESIINICNDKSIDVILPLMDDATVALSAQRALIEAKTQAWAVVSEESLCRAFLDKSESERWFLKNKVNIPHGDIEKDNYPFIIKSKRGYGSRDQAIIKSRMDFTNFISDRKISDYFIQPFITGTEYTIDAYVTRQGKVLGAVSRVRLETVNGEVSRGLTKREPELLQEVERILKIPGFEGPITLQAIKQKDTLNWFFIEVNPRFGGGCIQSIQAGANFTEALVAEALDKPLPDCSKWEEGLLMMRANQEIWEYKHEESW
jgi:carbamoyl-phosphate synthase large subunit